MAGATGESRFWRAGIALQLLPLGWIAGTALQLQQRALAVPIAYAAVLCVGLLLFAVAGRMARAERDSPWFFGTLCALAALAIAWGTTNWRADLQARQALPETLEGADLVLTGVIAAMPQHTQLGVRFTFRVEHATRPDHVAVDLAGLVQLSWYAQEPVYGEVSSAPAGGPRSLPAIHAGDRWRLSVRLKAPHGNVNPHGFDYELWLWQRGIGATGYVRNNARTPPPTLLAAREAHPVERLRESVRDRILALAGKDASTDERRRLGIVAALVTGDQNAIERSDWDVFRKTGVAHLVSISGLHITMFAWLAMLATGAAWRRLARAGARLRFNPCEWLPAPTMALLCGLMAGAAYAMFSGWGVPAQRTVLMLASVVFLRLAGLRWPWWLTWLWACAVVLAFDPWALLQAGFWLSFVAVGILFVTSPGVPQPGTNKPWNWFRSMALTQARVTVALAPLTLILFGQASVAGLLANLIAIPLVTFVVTPVAMAGLLWTPLWQGASASIIPLAHALAWLADLPGAQITTAAAPLLVGAFAAAGGILLVLRWPWLVRLAGAPMFLPLLLWQPIQPAPGQFELLAIDVGQGTAILIRTAAHSLLYDTGPAYSRDSDAGERVLLPLLQALAVRPDLVLLSHRDGDHAGGAASVLGAYPRARLVASLRPGDTLPGVPAGMPCRAGDAWTWEGVSFSILHPTPDDVLLARNSNALSCVLRVSTPQASVLLTGDIERAQERMLAVREPNLRSDVLLVPHHGSNTSSSADLLDAVRPRIALIQSGYRNRYGHPTERVLARYMARSVRVLDSPSCGAVHWSSNAPLEVACERERSRRYWRHDALRARQ